MPTAVPGPPLSVFMIVYYVLVFNDECSFTCTVLKAGHPVSCSCVFVLVCLVRVRGDLFSFFKFFGWCAIHMYFHVLCCGQVWPDDGR